MSDRSFSGRVGGVKFEVGPWTTPLEELIKQHERKPECESALALLRTALLLSKEEGDLSDARKRARREIEIRAVELQTLGGLTDRARDENYPQWYALMEVLQAASLASCNVSSRSGFSVNLALAAKATRQFDRARSAYADAIEGIRIADFLFHIKQREATDPEETLRKGWDRVKDQVPQPLHIFDPSTSDPAREWIDLVILNSDFGGANGLLAQIDATFRLAVRLQHWLDSDRGPLEPQVEKMLAHCESIGSGDDPLLPIRCTVTVGDALVEHRRWDLACLAYRKVVERSRGGLEATNPIALHAGVQVAYCALMMGDTKECLSQLEAVRHPIEAQADIVITAAATLARHHAVYSLCRHQLQERVPREERDRIAHLRKQVSIIASQRPADRVEYLRTLFFSVLVRDIEAAFKIIWPRSDG